MAEPFVPFYQRIPLIGKYLVSKSTYELYTAQGFEKAFETMLRDHPRAAVGLGLDDKLKKEVFNKDAFDKVVTGKVKDFAAFAKVKGADDEDLATKLKAATDPAIVNGIKDQIKNALVPTAQFKDAQTKYANAIAYLEKNPQGRRAEDLLGFMASAKDKAIKAIKEQHDIEKQELIAAFALAMPAAAGIGPRVPRPEGGLRRDLKITKALGGPGLSDDEVTALQKNMVAELEKSQAKELGEFTKSIEGNINKLHETQATQNHERLFIYNLYMNNPAMKEAILKQAKQIAPAQQTTITFNGKKQTVDFSGVRLSSLGNIISKTGKEIVRKEDGSYSMQFHDDSLFKSLLPNKLAKAIGVGSDFSYNLGPSQNAKSDLLLMAQAVRSENKEITFEFEGFEDQDLAMQRGREAYEAAIEAGFKPEDIAIKVNGVLYTNSKAAIPKDDKDTHKKIGADLFGEHQNAYHAINKGAPTFKERYERMEKVQTNTTEPLMQKIQDEADAEAARPANP